MLDEHGMGTGRDRDWGTDSLTVELETPHDLSFSQLLQYLSRSSREILFQVEGESVFRLLTLSGGSIPAEVSEAPGGRLQIRLPDTAETRQVRVQEEAAAWVRDWFDLDRNLEPFYRMAQEDTLLRPVAERFRGLRIIGIGDLFEALCWGILGQQINLAFAYTLKQRFVEAYGRRTLWDGRSCWAFPTPARIAALEPGDLTPLGISSRKAEYLLEVASRMHDGRLVLEELAALGDASRIEQELVAIRGIGPWTAHYVLMRCLRAGEAFPIADVGLHNAVRHELGLDRKPTLAELRQLSAGWGEWKAYATFYLWRVLY